LENTMHDGVMGRLTSWEMKGRLVSKNNVEEKCKITLGPYTV